MAVSGDTAVVGASVDDTAAGTDAGSAYVFVRSGAPGPSSRSSPPPTRAADDHFGRLGGGLGRHRGGGGVPRRPAPATRARRMCSSSRASPASRWPTSRPTRVTRYVAHGQRQRRPGGHHQRGGHRPRAARPGWWSTARGRLYVANQSNNTITEYAPGATGNTGPLATIGGGATQLSGPGPWPWTGREAVRDQHRRQQRHRLRPRGRRATWPRWPASPGPPPPQRPFWGGRGRRRPHLRGQLQRQHRHPLTRPGPPANQAPNLTITAGLSAPQNMVIDAAGVLYVTNSTNNTVTKYVKRRPRGHHLRLEALSIPVGIALDATGRLAVANFSGQLPHPLQPRRRSAPDHFSGPATGLNGPVGIAAVPVVTVTTPEPPARRPRRPGLLPVPGRHWRHRPLHLGPGHRLPARRAVAQRRRGGVGHAHGPGHLRLQRRGDRLGRPSRRPPMP